MYYGERLNSISHLVGGVLALMGLGALLTVSVPTGDPWLIAGFSLFGVTLVLMYTMSTLYHSIRAPEYKRLFQLLDHVAIYLLIAGTYAPYTLVSLRGTHGYVVLAIVWSLALIGIASEVHLTGRAVKVGQMTIFLGMGWLGSVEFANLRAVISPVGLSWLIAGGLAYTVGVIFYVLDSARKLTHAHGIWHFFVLAGSICHFISVIGFVR